MHFKHVDIFGVSPHLKDKIDYGGGRGGGLFAAHIHIIIIILYILTGGIQTGYRAIL